MSMLLSLVQIGKPAQNDRRLFLEENMELPLTSEIFRGAKLNLPDRLDEKMLPRREEGPLRPTVSEEDQRFDSIQQHQDHFNVVYENQKAYPLYCFRFKRRQNQ
jgi:hypothetical protein